MKTGTEIIADERRRQIEEEGYNAKYDDSITDGELSTAASIYAMRLEDREYELESGYTIAETIWPWGARFYKPSKEDIYTTWEHTSDKIEDRIHELAKAGALIAAEIDRLQRKLKNKKNERNKF